MSNKTTQSCPRKHLVARCPGANDSYMVRWVEFSVSVSVALFSLYGMSPLQSPINKSVDILSVKEKSIYEHAYCTVLLYCRWTTAVSYFVVSCDILALSVLVCTVSNVDPDKNVALLYILTLYSPALGHFHVFSIYEVFCSVVSEAD